jgi:hypothetical protein
MSLSVSVLITNYESWDDARLCVEKVIEHAGSEVDRILIADDASSSPPPLLPERVDVVRNSENLGFPATLNRGFRELTEDVIVHFDADGHPLMDFAIPTRQAFTDDEDLGALGFHMVDHDGDMTGSFTHESDISLTAFVAGQQIGRLFRSNGTSDLLLPNACGTAVRRSAYVDAGGFDESFDLLDVDLDFFLRLARRDWMIRYTPHIRAYHEGGGSPQTTATRVLRHHRDRWRLLRKHGYVNQPQVTKLCLTIRHIAEYVVLSILGRQLYDNQTQVQDKIEGRRRLLQSVWNDYQTSSP